MESNDYQVAVVKRYAPANNYQFGYSVAQSTTIFKVKESSVKSVRLKSEQVTGASSRDEVR